MNLQTSLVLLQSPIATKTQLPQETDGQGTEVEEPFSHPALDGLPNLTNVKVDDILSKERLANLATQMGMPDIIRWEPRMVSCSVILRGAFHMATNSLYRRIILRSLVLNSY